MLESNDCICVYNVSDRKMSDEDAEVEVEHHENDDSESGMRLNGGELQFNIKLQEKAWIGKGVPRGRLRCLFIGTCPRSSSTTTA